MKMCERHWNDLKKRINERGLMHFCASSDRMAAERIRERNRVGVSRDNFEPLMSAYYRIATNAIDQGGLKADQDCCPLCELNAHFVTHGGDDSNKWINRAVHEQVKIAEKLGLLAMTH